MWLGDRRNRRGSPMMVDGCDGLQSRAAER